MIQVDNLLHLPAEILLHILQFLTSEELSALLAPACTSLCRLCNHESNWKRLCHQDFNCTEILGDPLSLDSADSITWKQWYIFLGTNTLHFAFLVKQDSQLQFNKQMSAPKLEMNGNRVRTNSFVDKIAMATPKVW